MNLEIGGGLYLLERSNAGENSRRGMQNRFCLRESARACKGRPRMPSTRYIDLSQCCFDDKNDSSWNFMSFPGICAPVVATRHPGVRPNLSGFSRHPAERFWLGLLHAQQILAGRTAFLRPRGAIRFVMIDHFRRQSLAD